LVGVVAISLHRLHQRDAGELANIEQSAQPTRVDPAMKVSPTTQPMPPAALDEPPTTIPSRHDDADPAVQRTDGSIVLSPAGARIHGYKLRVQLHPHALLVGWTDPQEYVEWPQGCPTAGAYEVEITYSCAPGAGGEFAVVAAAARVQGRAENTGGWQTFRTAKLGTLTIANDHTPLALRPTGSINHCLLYLRSIRLTPIGRTAHGA
jgi:hypothetical protein